jgi:hypothetical protein
MARRSPARTNAHLLRGIKTSGNWWDKHPTGREGKRCEITGGGGAHGTPGARTYIDDVKQCAQICKSHFFEPETMRFFSSRVGETAYHDGRGGAYFTTSEKGPDGRRGYSVRHYDPERCGVETVGKFQGYATAAQAQGAAKRAATRGGLGRRRRR